MNFPSALILTGSENVDIIKINLLYTRKSAIILRAVNHKLRQQIIRLIDEQKKISVTDIYVQLRLEQSVTSQHLSILRRAGIVITHRSGKFIYYKLNYLHLKQLNDFVEQFVG